MASINAKEFRELIRIFHKASGTLIKSAEKHADIRSRLYAETTTVVTREKGLTLIRERVKKNLSQEEYRSLEKKYDVLHDNLDKKTRSRLTELLTKALNIVKEGE